MRALRIALIAMLVAGCASSGRFLWEEYTSEGIASIGAGQYDRAEKFLTRALAKAEGLGPRERGISLNGLGELYRRQGRYRDAERMFARALEVKEAGLGANHPDVATTLTNLALVYVAEGRDAEAGSALERALAIQERALPSDHRALGRTLMLLAEVYRRLGRDDEARPLDARARALREAPRER